MTFKSVAWSLNSEGIVSKEYLYYVCVHVSSRRRRAAALPVRAVLRYRTALLLSIDCSDLSCHWHFVYNAEGEARAR